MTRRNVLLSLAFLSAVNANPHAQPEPTRVHRRAPSPTMGGLYERGGHFVERQNPYPTGPAYDVPPLASIVPTPVEYTENTLPVISTYAPGSVPTGLSGAPPIPTFALDPSRWPDLASVPPTDSPEVQEWMKELEGINIPTYEPNISVDCGNASNAQALSEAGPGGRCWWTCGGCLRDTDIATCENKWDYGLTFDDGPGFYTNKLLTYLDSVSLKATFYVVGARVISRPDIVVYEHMTGHELSIHTWSHSALTMLTNEQIVAELGWTRKAIKDVTGVTPLTMRPPYGDIDDRVRAISLAMGLVPVIWTAVDEDNNGDPTQWDSNDWRVHDPASNLSAVTNQQNFQSILDRTGDLADNKGAVVLHHDIYVEAVNLAIGYTLPWVLAHEPKFGVKPVTICQNRPLADSYLETLTDPNHPAVDESQGGGASFTQTGTRTGGQGTPTGANQGGVAARWDLNLENMYIATALGIFGLFVGAGVLG